MNTKETKAIPIPPDELSQEALDGLVQSFILREGTDYGHSEVSFEKKCQQVMNQIQKGKSLIFFEPESQSLQIITKEEWKKALPSEK